MSEKREEIVLVDIVKKHDSQIKQHETQLKIHSEQIRNIETSNLKLENTVMVENRETRSTIMQTNRELHELINNLLGYKSGQNQLQSNVVMNRTESLVKIVGILAGSGGILYYIFG